MLLAFTILTWLWTQILIELSSLFRAIFPYEHTLISPVSGKKHDELFRSFVAVTNLRSEHDDLFELDCTQIFLDQFHDDKEAVLKEIKSTSDLSYSFANKQHFYMSNYNNRTSGKDGLHIDDADRLTLRFIMEGPDLNSRILNFQARIMNSYE